MNHECIKDLSMKISIEFKDQVSRFLSEGYSESKILIQVRGVTSKIQMYIFTVPSPCNRRTIVGIESVQYLPYQSMYIQARGVFRDPPKVSVHNSKSF